MRSLRKLLYTILLMGSLFTTVSCEDLAFGDKFLQKPPSSDVTSIPYFLQQNMRVVSYGRVISHFLTE